MAGNIVSQNYVNDFLLLLMAYSFMWPLDKMKNRKISNGVILAIACVILQGLRMFTSLMTDFPVSEIALRMMITTVAILLCYRKVCWEAFYCDAWSFVLFYSTSLIYSLFFSAIGGEGLDWRGMIGLQLLFFAFVYFLLSITLLRWMPGNGKYHAGPRKTISAIFVFFFSEYSYFYYVHGKVAASVAVLIQVYCVTFLYMQAELFKSSEIKQELGMMKQLWYQQKKQYEIAKDQMNVIDRKCHDLKYQVAAMRNMDNPQERDATLKELEKSIRIYDSLVKTGNEILDTLLSEKSLVCEARDIAIHCVIDGSKLSFMDSVDIYALFGNAIDNAIECVEQFADHEKRFIDVSVAQKQQLLYIRISNPVLENPVYEGGLPKTTKKDKQYHGIGLKSIRHIAEQYQGQIHVGTEMNCFILEILIPLTNK